MHKQILLLPLTAFILACVTMNSFFGNASQRTAAEEQAVYSVLLSEYRGQNVVLYDSTESGFEYLEDDAVPEFIRSAAPGASQETLDDYLSRNDKSYSLSTDLDIGVDYLLLSHEQLDEIFNGSEDAWAEFYKRYPNSPGVTTLSRVGFNREFTEAIVYIGKQFDYLAGTGNLVRLEKQNGVWKIMEEIGIWNT